MSNQYKLNSLALAYSYRYMGIDLFKKIENDIIHDISVYLFKNCITKEGMFIFDKTNYWNKLPVLALYMIEKGKM